MHHQGGTPGCLLQPRWGPQRTHLECDFERGQNVVSASLAPDLVVRPVGAVGGPFSSKLLSVIGRGDVV